MGYFLEIGFDAQFCGQVEKIVFIQNLQYKTLNNTFIEHIGIPIDKNCYYNILGNSVESIMKDDGCGFGDLIACCPECGEPFIVPLYWKGNSFPCRKCNTLITNGMSNF